MSTITQQDFEHMIEEAFASIPERFRQKVHNVAFIAEHKPTKDNVLGLYHGVPKTVRHHYGVGGQLPDIITIYRDSIVKASDGSIESIRRLVYETVWHEIAHHFGMEEEMVREWEKRKRRMTD